MKQNVLLDDTLDFSEYDRKMTHSEKNIKMNLNHFYQKGGSSKVDLRIIKNIYVLDKSLQKSMAEKLKNIFHQNL